MDDKGPTKHTIPKETKMEITVTELVKFVV